jgi:hypothetical protein
MIITNTKAMRDGFFYFSLKDRAHGLPAVFYQEQKLMELILGEHMVHPQCFICSVGAADLCDIDY